MRGAAYPTRWIAWLGVLVVGVTSCSAATGASQTSSPAGASRPAIATSSSVGGQPTLEPSTAIAPASTGPVAPVGSPATPDPAPETGPAAAVTPDPTAGITIAPANGATGISPLEPVVIRATSGTLGSVALRNPAGKSVAGVLSADETTWTSAEPLGYNKRYTASATSVASPGGATLAASFTTLKPDVTVFPSFYPPPSTTVVGVGQPMVVIFSEPPVDRAAAEKTLTVTAEPATEGAWYWWDDRTVHWRPKEYWKPGTKVTVTAKVYGVQFGPGMYGETDRTLNVTIGSSKIAVIDDVTKQMDVFIDGRKVRTVPVSMGMDKAITVNGKKISFVTPSGTYVAQEKYDVKQMSSASYGLPVNYDLGYDSAIPLAIRLSYSGIFIHSAPWSVKDQGVRNVSHGCININPTDAAWFYDTFGYGDIVTVKGTDTPLESHDGFGDWNIPWSQWLEGSALR